MSYSKICSFGKKQLEISSDTKVALRTATKQEAENFKKVYFEIPEAPVLTEDFLNKLTQTLTVIDSIAQSQIFVELSKGNESFTKYAHIFNLRFTLEKIYPNLNKCQVKLQAIEYCHYSLYKDGEVGSIDFDIYDIGVIFDSISKYLKVSKNEAKENLKKQYGMLSFFADKSLSRNYGAYESFCKDNRAIIDTISNYCNKMKKIIARNDFSKFIEAMESYRLRVLQVDDELFFENFCDFDVPSKYEEVQSICKKINNSYDVGENRVEYEIKWFLAECDLGIIPIKSDCESKYRYNSIMLCKPDFINEPQEYDHILVTPAGIVIIETKNWKGRVEIRNDGKWLKEKEDKTDMVGIENPGMQMHRHELLMKKILPEVPIYNVLCFSNSSVVIDGIKNFSNYPIIRVEQLREFLGDICSNSKYTGDEMNSFADIIEKHKINKF